MTFNKEEAELAIRLSDHKGGPGVMREADQIAGQNPQWLAAAAAPVAAELLKIRAEQRNAKHGISNALNLTDAMVDTNQKNIDGLQRARSTAEGERDGYKKIAIAQGKSLVQLLDRVDLLHKRIDALTEHPIQITNMGGELHVEDVVKIILAVRG